MEREWKDSVNECDMGREGQKVVTEKWWVKGTRERRGRSIKLGKRQPTGEGWPQHGVLHPLMYSYHRAI